MAKLAGYNAYLGYKTSGTVYTEIGYLSNVTINVDATAIDVSDNTSGKAREFISGKAGWTASATYFYESTGGQDTLLGLLNAGTEVDVVFRPKDGTGHDEYTGTAILTTWTMESPQDGAISGTYELTGTSLLTAATQ